MTAKAKNSTTPAKTVVKPDVKIKTAPKAVEKAVKPVAKKTPIVEIDQKAVPAKAAVKVASGKSNAMTKTSKPVVKTVPEKLATRTTTENIIKAPSKPAVVKPTLQVQVGHAVVAGKKAAPSVIAPTPLSVPRPAQKTMLIPVPPALKPGRRSSARTLSQMPPPAPMVPTHAPDAAKASYSAMIERVIAPPPHVAAKKDPKLADNWKSKTADALTDDEVKAMPDSEYMNEKQMAFFRHKLSVLKQEIHNSAGETTEHLREDTVVVPDPADRATIEEEHALELRTRDRERKLLKKIEQSIARIDSGDYGYCDETGEPIGVGRLIARPTANLSLEAQQRRELKQKMFGD